MADAVAALNLASNVLQVIDCGSKFVSIAWKIYRSGKSVVDSVDELADLQKINSNLYGVLDKLQTPSSGLDDVSSDHHGIIQLATECSRLVQKLLGFFRDLSLGGNGRKRDAIKAAFKIMWKEDDIRAIQDAINEFRQQLTLNLLVSLRDYAVKSLDRQQLVLQQLQTMQERDKPMERKETHSYNGNEGLGNAVLDLLTSSLSYYREEEKRALHKCLLNAIHDDSQGESDTHSMGFTISQDERRKLEITFTSQLRYHGMQDREGRIAKAHESTFHWIFENNPPGKVRWSNLREWLESDSKLYWITGKAGSGKSTLMKFICSSSHGDEMYGPGSQPHPKCMEHLKKWSGDSKLIIGRFYFWNSGIQLQMTQMGLFMTLLHQILFQCPHLIPYSAPSRWEALCLFREDPWDWTEEELARMLQRAAACLDKAGAQLCLFVDGFDEFDGNHEDLIKVFKGIISTESKARVKICFASRPWVVFEDAFKQSPSMMLQDLTYFDIKNYVSKTFEAYEAFAQLRKREPLFAEQLVENVVSKAAGVFLWVNLVVSSLIAGMGHGDRVSDLQRRLDQLPPDLEKLYENILLTLDPFYLEHAAQYFSLVKASAEPPDVLLMSFADEDVESVLGRPIGRLEGESIILRAETMRRRLNSRCKGLLEVERQNPRLTDYYAPEPLYEVEVVGVQYLHRTVKDYIETEDVQAMLRKAMIHPFDPNIQLCLAHLACLKISNTSNWANDAISWADNWHWHLVQACLQYAKKADLATEQQKFAMISLLDELEKTGQAVFQALAQLTPMDESKKALANAGFWVLSPTPLASGDTSMPDYGFGCSFLSLAVYYDLVDYVRVRVNRGCLVQRPTCVSPIYPLNNTCAPSQAPILRICTSVWPLLLDAVKSRTRSLRMIQALLEKGADPNFKTDIIRKRSGAIYPCISTPWVELLIQLRLVFLTRTGTISEGTRTSEILEAMLQKGARTGKDVVSSVSAAFNGFEALYDENWWENNLLNALRAARSGEFSTLEDWLKHP